MALGQQEQYVPTDPKLVNILTKAAAQYMDANPQYEVQLVSGYRAGDTREHGRKNAIDVVIIDKATGKELPNYQNGKNFYQYQDLANTARGVQKVEYPKLTDKFRWGGYFSSKTGLGGYGAFDLMHFDLAGDRLSMLAGSWDKGLTPAATKYYGVGPRPPAPLLNDTTPIGSSPEDYRTAVYDPSAVTAPATMSRELAYARGLSNPTAALEAINRATGAGATRGLDAYMGGASGGLSAQPVAPTTDTSAFAPRAQALPPSLTTQSKASGISAAAPTDWTNATLGGQKTRRGETVSPNLYATPRIGAPENIIVHQTATSRAPEAMIVTEQDNANSLFPSAQGYRLAADGTVRSIAKDPASGQYRTGANLYISPDQTFMRANPVTDMMQGVVSPYGLGRTDVMQPTAGVSNMGSIQIETTGFPGESNEQTAQRLASSLVKLSNDTGIGRDGILAHSALQGGVDIYGKPIAGAPEGNKDAREGNAVLKRALEIAGNAIPATTDQTKMTAARAAADARLSGLTLAATQASATGSGTSGIAPPQHLVVDKARNKKWVSSLDSVLKAASPGETELSQLMAMPPRGPGVIDQGVKAPAYDPMAGLLALRTQAMQGQTGGDFRDEAFARMAIEAPAATAALRAREAANSTQPIQPPADWGDFYDAVLGKSAAAPTSQEPNMFDAARASIAKNKALESIPFASDLALKRLAAAKDPNSGLFTGGIGAGQYNPQAALALLSEKDPNSGLFLGDIGGGQYNPQISYVDTPGVPGRGIPATTARSAPSGIDPNMLATSPLATANVPLTAPRATGENIFAPPATGLRDVASLIAPTMGAPSGLGMGVTGFGMTPVGSIQPTPFINPAITAPTPQTRGAVPTVNEKGFFLGNPLGDYALKSGETLGKVAKKFGTTVDNLAAINNIPNVAKVMAGARLLVNSPSVAPVTPAARINRPSTSSSSTTPVSTYKPTVYTPPRATTTSSTGASIPVYSSASITPTRVATATTPTGRTVTQAQMNAIRGLATGGPVQKYATGSAVLDWSGGADYQKNLVDALKKVEITRKLASLTPIGAVSNVVADTFFPDQTKSATWNIAQTMAAPKSGTTRQSTSGMTNMERLSASGWSPSMMEGSPSSSSRNTSRSQKDNNDGAKGGGSSSSSSSGSSGGIDGIIGTYNPPTQAQIDALYAPYFQKAAFPAANYVPGVSGEFNYFPATTASTPTTPTTTPTTTINTSAKDWYNNYVNSLRDRSKREEAKKVMADDKTSFYSLFDQYRNSVGDNKPRGGKSGTPNSMSLDNWLSWLSTKGYAEGGAISEPRLVLGQGGPTADKIPARIDGVQEARLSNGEFVMTAAAVRGLGNGDYHRGAEALMRLNDQFAPRKDKGTLKVEKVR